MSKKELSKIIKLADELKGLAEECMEGYEDGDEDEEAETEEPAEGTDDKDEEGEDASSDNSGRNKAVLLALKKRVGY